jgi:predicted O-methyltransferase YrrM
MHDLPPLVHAAVKLAADQRFDHSCAPEQGRLLSVLARGWSGGRVGETGTGYGVGLAWMVEAAHPSTSFVSLETDPLRVAAAENLFAPHPQVRVLRGEWTELARFGPFDLLVLDGGGKGKDPSVDRPLDPTAGWVTVGGTIVLDDFIPDGQPGSEQHDQVRRHWLEHPALQATELRLSPTLATIVAVRVR